jgi:AcrR family transcriptional regulator
MRSERTRAGLLKAAEVVFARDGFEASRIEDIAAAAGRSRGAFYANFATKTEVFLALRALLMQRRAREVRELLEPISLDEPGGEEARYQAVIGYVLAQICDTQTLLLQMEFKLFALRHPQMLDELSEKHLEAALSVNKHELAHLFETRGETEDEIRSNTLAIEAILEGFALNAMFSRRGLTEERIGELVPELLSKVFKRMPSAEVR